MNWAKHAHKICFAENRDPDMDRLDFVLLGANPVADLPGGYCTCREFDSKTIYWQYGGAFPGTRSTLHVARIYKAFVDYCLQRYDRITTYVENDNISYLKLAMHHGFRIMGVRLFDGRVYVELLNEPKGEK